MLLPTDPEEANSVIGPISGGIAAGIVMLLAIIIVIIIIKRWGYSKVYHAEKVIYTQ